MLLAGDSRIQGETGYVVIEPLDEVSVEAISSSETKKRALIGCYFHRLRQSESREFAVTRREAGAGEQIKACYGEVHTVRQWIRCIGVICVARIMVLSIVQLCCSPSF